MGSNQGKEKNVASAIVEGHRVPFPTYFPTPRETMSLDVRHSLLSRLRISSLLDGFSYVILLGIAMPLKYLADQPLAVRIVGSLHGLFFLALCWYLLRNLLARKLSFGWCVIVFVCALFPFAPFFLDRKLAKFEDKSAE